MSAPKNHDADLPMSARLVLASLGSGAPKQGYGEANGKGKSSLTAQIERLGWKLLPIPFFWPAGHAWHDPLSGKRNAAFIDFNHVREWLIVPPEESSIRARKVAGKICAIRVAHRLATVGEAITATGDN